MQDSDYAQNGSREGAPCVDRAHVSRFLPSNCALPAVFCQLCFARVGSKWTLQSPSTCPLGPTGPLKKGCPSHERPRIQLVTPTCGNLESHLRSARVARQSGKGSMPMRGSILRALLADTKGNALSTSSLVYSWMSRSKFTSPKSNNVITGEVAVSPKERLCDACTRKPDKGSPISKSCAGLKESHISVPVFFKVYFLGVGLQGNQKNNHNSGGGPSPLKTHPLICK